MAVPVCAEASAGACWVPVRWHCQCHGRAASDAGRLLLLSLIRTRVMLSEPSQLHRSTRSIRTIEQCTKSCCGPPPMLPSVPRSWSRAELGKRPAVSNPDSSILRPVTLRESCQRNEHPRTYTAPRHTPLRCTCLRTCHRRDAIQQANARTATHRQRDPVHSAAVESPPAPAPSPSPPSPAPSPSPPSVAEAAAALTSR